MTSRSPSPARRAPSAFTVVELMVAVSVLTLIVVVLYNMFDNTQRAMRSNAAQVDVMEGGRAAVELLGRDLEQMTDAGMVTATNFYVNLWSQPTFQSLPGETNASNVRMNLQQELFFTARFNKEARGIGYRVVPDTGVGSLYRFVTSEPTALLTSNLLSGRYRLFANTNNPGMFQRVTDGVVHFRVTAYDSQGQVIDPRYCPTNRVVPLAYPRDWYYPGVAMGNPGPGLPPSYVFTNTAVPASVEIELGILEPYILERYRGMTANRPVVSASASNYLAQQAARVHMFQQRIPVRSAPPLRPVFP
jgi:competence protein ComGC